MKGRGKWGWWLAGGFALAGITGILVAYYVTGFGVYDLPPVARQLQANQAEAAKAGIWTVPPTGTGAMAYGDFRTMAAGVKGLAKGVQVPAEGLTREGAARKRAEIAVEVAKARDLAAVESVELDFVTGAFPEFLGMRVAAEILAYDAELAAKAGHEAEVIDRLQEGRRLAQLAGKRNVRVGLLISHGFEDIVNRAAVKIAGSWAGRPELLASLSKVFEPPLYEADAGTIARGEELNARLYWLNMPDKKWSDMSAFAETEDGNEAPKFSVPVSMARDAMMARHYEVHSRLIAAADKGWDEFGKEMRAIGDEAAKTKSLTWRMYRGFSELGNESRTFAKARQAALRGGLAYLARAARRPEDLYAPGQPVRIAPQPKGFVAYSVGFNKTDDGGQLKKDRADVGYLFPMAK